MSAVVAVFWLLSGEPAFDYMQRDQCHQVRAMTAASGSVTLTLADGSELVANRVECIPVQAIMQLQP
jgi:hypothetical protein